PRARPPPDAQPRAPVLRGGGPGADARRVAGQRAPAGDAAGGHPGAPAARRGDAARPAPGAPAGAAPPAQRDGASGAVGDPRGAGAGRRQQVAGGGDRGHLADDAVPEDEGPRHPGLPRRAAVASRDGAEYELACWTFAIRRRSTGPTRPPTTTSRPAS